MNLCFGISILTVGQTNSIPHLEKKGDVTQLIVDGKPFLMLGGELHNSSMGGVEYMRPIWKRMADANLNTVLASASWEMVEPAIGSPSNKIYLSSVARPEKHAHHKAPYIFICFFLFIRTTKVSERF